MVFNEKKSDLVIWRERIRREKKHSSTSLVDASD
jgi:hypothetical protein